MNFFHLFVRKADEKYGILKGLCPLSRIPKGRALGPPEALPLITHRRESRW